MDRSATTHYDAAGSSSEDSSVEPDTLKVDTSMPLLSFDDVEAISPFEVELSRHFSSDSMELPSLAECTAETGDFSLHKALTPIGSDVLNCSISNHSIPSLSHSEGLEVCDLYSDI